MLLKIESSYGVDAVPSASVDALIVENPVIDFPSEVIDPPAASGSIGPIAPIVTRRTGTLTFDVTLRGSGAAGTPPDWGAALKACGFGETIVASTSVAYGTISTAIPSATIYYNVDGILYKLLGARGNVTFNFAARERAYASFEFQGRPQAFADQTLPTLSGTDTTPPLIVESAGFTFGGESLVTDQVVIAMQNSLGFSDDINQPDAVGELILGSRNAQVSINPEATAVADVDFWDLWQTAANNALAMSLGSTAGNILAVSAPKCVIRELSPGDREGAHIYEIQATAWEVGDGDVVLTCT